MCLNQFCGQTHIISFPYNFPAKKKTAIYSEGPKNLPGGVGPFDRKTEKLIVTSLLSSLCEKLRVGGVNIDCDPYTNGRTDSQKECPDILVIGGEHAELTCASLARRGATTQLLHIPNYRMSSLHSGKIREGLASLETKDDTWIVVQVFDSALYMAAPKEGGLIPPCMRADGKIHVDGDLVMLSKDLQYEFFRQLDKELSGHKHLKTVFMAPLPRYYLESCCADPDHVGNRSQPEFQKKMEDGVFNARANLKNFAFRHGYRRSVAVSSWAKVRKQEELWEDQVKMKTKGYDALAEAILVAGGEIERKRKRSGKQSAPVAKKAKLDTSSGGGDSGGGGTKGTKGGGDNTGTGHRGGNSRVSVGGRGRGRGCRGRGNSGGSNSGVGTGRGGGGSDIGVGAGRGGGGSWSDPRRGRGGGIHHYGGRGQRGGSGYTGGGYTRDGSSHSSWFRADQAARRGRGGWYQPRGHSGPRGGGGHFF
jgi:hypothetical protein